MTASARRLLIADDDPTLLATLGRALERRGYEVSTAESRAGALEIARRDCPELAIVDLRLGDDSGLGLLGDLLAERPDMRIVILTGYASIATAVQAVRDGAWDYLTKPVDIAALVQALEGGTASEASAPPVPPPLSPRRLEWEHIQRVLEAHGGNVSATARALGMHRRTLQRKLAKRPAGR